MLKPIKVIYELTSDLLVGSPLSPVPQHNSDMPVVREMRFPTKAALLEQLKDPAAHWGKSTFWMTLCRAYADTDKAWGEQAKAILDDSLGVFNND